MKRRLSVNERGQLVDREGTVVGRIASITLDLDEPNVGVRGVAVLEDKSSTAVALSSNAQEKLLPVGGAGEDSPGGRNSAYETGIVWAHYEQVIPSGKLYTLDNKKRQIIRNALKVRPLDQVLRAVSGLAASPHHNGQNDRRKKYLGIRYALQGIGGESNDERIDKMAALAVDASGVAGGPAGLMGVADFAATFPSGVQENIHSHVRNVRRMIESPDHETLASVGKDSGHVLAERFGVAVIFDAGETAPTLRRLDSSGKEEG